VKRRKGAASRIESPVQRIRFTVEVIGEQHDTSGFDCGEPTLDEYLTTHALENTRRGLGVTYLVLAAEPIPPGMKRLLGYYTLSMMDVEPEQLPRSVHRGLPRYPVPAVLIGRLAVDRTMQGRGFGGEILVDALFRALSASRKVGAFCVVVDALSDRAQAFYESYGFQPTTDRPRRLFLRMKKIEML
jgi:GNAT superfamily N-acetyltransferase